MSDRDNVLIEKILEYCYEIEKTHEYFKNDLKLFMNSEEGYIYRNSLTMPILQIGELAKLLSDDFTKKHSDIPWKMIMRMRDVVAHHYGNLDFEIVWNTSKDDISELKMKIESLVQKGAR